MEDAMRRCLGKRTTGDPNRAGRLALSATAVLLLASATSADVVQFFDPSQQKQDVSSGVTSDTISSDGYLFTYTRDKLFDGGLGGGPIGRAERVHWPDGIEAQAVTKPPPGVTDQTARFTVSRVDGDVFDMTSFTAKLLANTAGAGGSIEIMPLLPNGEDAFNDPAMFLASGVAGQSFHYDETTPAFLGNTSSLKGFDTYKVGLYVDFALTSLTFEGAPVPEPSAVAVAAAVVTAASAPLTRRRRTKAQQQPAVQKRG
jgi:hypothetical protein